MPTKWIESAGPDENVLSKAAFETWWKENYGVDEYDQLIAKKTAFATWEHQRRHCSDLIKQILSEIEKEST